jgi:hypothetical protein
MKDLKRQTVKTWRFLEYFSEKARRGESGYPHFSGSFAARRLATRENVGKLARSGSRVSRPVLLGPL